MYKEGARGFISKSLETFEVRDSIRKAHAGECFPDSFLRSLDEEPDKMERKSNYIFKPSQLNMIYLLEQGLLVKEIANKTGFSLIAVSNRLRKLRSIMGVRNNVQLASKATALKLIQTITRCDHRQTSLIKY